MLEVISREEAKARGLKRYFTGEPCKRGHVAERYACSRGCVACREGLAPVELPPSPPAQNVVFQGGVVSQEEARARGLKRFFVCDPCQNGHLVERYVVNGKCVSCSKGIPPGPHLPAPIILFDGPIVTQSEAVARGLDRYFTGIPCKNRHVSERYAANGGCIGCHREKYNADKEEKLSKNKAWYAANSEKARAYSRSWYQNNLEAAKSYRRSWYILNPEAARAYRRNRDAREKLAEGRHTSADIQRIGDAQGWRCFWCDDPTADKYHVDHLVPLARGGTNWPDNLCIACPTCNQRKHAKDPLEFIEELARAA